MCLPDGLGEPQMREEGRGGEQRRRASGERNGQRARLQGAVAEKAAVDLFGRDFLLLGVGPNNSYMRRRPHLPSFFLGGSVGKQS
jgi:hypothetical protein